MNRARAKKNKHDGPCAPPLPHLLALIPHPHSVLPNSLEAHVGQSAQDVAPFVLRLLFLSLTQLLELVRHRLCLLRPLLACVDTAQLKIGLDEIRIHFHYFFKLLRSLVQTVGPYVELAESQSSLCVSRIKHES